MVEAASGDSDDEKLGNFANFSRYMSREYTKSGLLSEADAFRVNSFVEGFHDALLLFAFLQVGLFLCLLHPTHRFPLTFGQVLADNL